MYSIDPQPGAFSAALKQLPKGQPVVMLNLLKFHEQAQYDDESEPCTGRQAYARYSQQAFEHVTAIGGDVIWVGDAKAALIAPPDESWDEVILVRYPSIEKFVEMVMNPEYQAFSKHRTAALENARLIATVER
jgi:uncharacterized protein (DUF1330 family)